MNISLLIIFTLFGLIIGLLEIKYKKTIPFGSGLYALFFVLFVTFRPMYYPDTIAYSSFFREIVTSHIYQSRYEVPLDVELGYAIFNQLIRIIFGEQFRFLFFMLVVLNVFLIGKSTKGILITWFSENGKSINYGLLFSLYFSFYGLLYNGAVLRAGMALSLLFYSYMWVIKRKWLLALVFYLIAIQFHDSAILGFFVVVLLMFDIKINRKFYYYLWFLIGLLYFAQIGELFTKYVPQMLEILSKYQSFDVFSKYNNYYTGFGGGISLRFIYFYLLGGLFLMARNSVFYIRLVNIYFVGLLLFVLFPISFMSRVIDFFLLIGIILQYLFFQTQKKLDVKVIVFVSIIILNTLFISRILYQGII